MNSVVLIGRLTRDPETRYTSGSQMAVCSFTIAIDRVTRQGEEKKTDFPRITVFWSAFRADCRQAVIPTRTVQPFIPPMS